MGKKLRLAVEKQVNVVLPALRRFDLDTAIGVIADHLRDSGYEKEADWLLDSPKYVGETRFALQLSSAGRPMSRKSWARLGRTVPPDTVPNDTQIWMPIQPDGQMVQFHEYREDQTAPMFCPQPGDD
jgi:hypothetical protein